MISKAISRNAALMATRERHVARGVATTHPIFAARASGATLVDVDGVEYLDFAGGIGVLAVGHNHPRVLAAAKAQLEDYTHTCFQVAMYEPYVQLAERLNALVGGSRPNKSVFFSTGAEAVENAVKIARSFTKRPAVIAFHGSFHGRTLMGMSLTGMTNPYTQNFGPFAPDVYHAPYPYQYRGWTTERALAALDDLLETEIAAERVAAVIIEPQLGDGGFVPAPQEFMRSVRSMTQAKGILLIADEIQTGYGRTGTMFAFEHSGIEPDLVTVGKSMAAGFPLSGVVGRADAMDAPLPGGLGGTYAGNPVACAAALAVLSVFEEERLLERSIRIGARLRAGLLELQRQHPKIGDVRGLGAMQAVELVEDVTSKRPAAAFAQNVLDAARRSGLLLLKCGVHRNVLRFLVPLVATDDQLDRSLALLKAALGETEGSGNPMHA